MPKHQVRELFAQYVGGLQEWQIKLAIARMLRFRVPQDVWQDTMQELAVVIVEFSFDRAKAGAASEETILCRRLDHRIRMLARGNARQLGFMSRLGGMRLQTVDPHTPDDDAAEGDMSVLLGGLTPLQQQICQGLMRGLSIPQIAKATGRHHATIGRHVEHIRQAFIDREVDTWLQ